MQERQPSIPRHEDGKTRVWAPAAPPPAQPGLASAMCRLLCLHRWLLISAGISTEQGQHIQWQFTLLGMKQKCAPVLARGDC
ncbi:unnamed protein product [Caretta caretta]